jgi:glycosyltransferase involved in cell wall biosynthesis
MIKDGRAGRNPLKFTLLVLTWNEYDAMIQVMPKVDRSLFHQILVVDGGSTDGTIEWARKQGYEVHVQTKPGMRQAYLEAMKLVTGDAVITFSPDGNSMPEKLPALIEKMREGFDMVIVSRYLPPARSEDDGWVTGFGNWFFTTLTNFLHHASYTDAFVMYRAYRPSLLHDLGLLNDDAYRTPERIFNTRLPIEPLLSVRVARAGLRIGEIPGDEPPRIGGERKLQVIRWGLGFLYQIVREALPESSPADSYRKRQ